MLVFTSLDGSFHRWANPIPDDLPSPVRTEAQTAKKLDRLLDDDFGDEDDAEVEDKGEDLDELEGDLLGDDWIVDDDDGEGGYGENDDEKRWSKRRTEVGECGSGCVVL